MEETIMAKKVILSMAVGAGAGYGYSLLMSQINSQ